MALSQAVELKKSAYTSRRNRFSQSLNYLRNKAIMDTSIGNFISKEIVACEENGKLGKPNQTLIKNDKQSVLKEEQANKNIENVSSKELCSSDGQVSVKLSLDKVTLKPSSSHQKDDAVLKAKNKSISSSKTKETQCNLKETINNDYHEPLEGIFQKQSGIKFKNLKSNVKQEKLIQIKKTKNSLKDKDLMLEEINESDKVLEESVTKKKNNSNPPKNQMLSNLISQESKITSLSLLNEHQINDCMQKTHYNNTEKNGKRRKTLMENNENLLFPQRNEITKNNLMESSKQSLKESSSHQRDDAVSKAKNKSIFSSKTKEIQYKLKKTIKNDYDKPLEGIFEKDIRDTVDNETQNQNISHELTSRTNKRKHACMEDIEKSDDIELKKIESNDKQQKLIHNEKTNKNKNKKTPISQERNITSLSLFSENQINDCMQKSHCNNTGKKSKRKNLMENNENLSPQRNEIPENNLMESPEQSRSTIHNTDDRRAEKSCVNHYKTKVIGTSLKRINEDNTGELKEADDMKFDGNSQTRNKRKLGEWPPLRSKCPSIVPDVLDFEETERNEYVISEEVQKKLHQLELSLPWEVPPLHLAFPCIGRRPPMAKQKEIENQGIRINRGVYKKYEDDIIQKNFQDFCKLHDLDVDPVPFLHLRLGNNLVFKKKQRAIFAQFIAHGLNERILYSVYNRFRRLYWPSFGKAGRFTEEEDSSIISYINNSSSSKPIVDLTHILRRNHKSISHRYMVLSEKRPRITWSVDMIQKFVNELLEISSVEDIHEFEKREITHDEYKQLSKNLNIPVEKLRRAWCATIFPKLFSGRTLTQSTLKEIKSSLVTKLYEAKVRDWKSADFQSLAQDYDGIPSLKLYIFLKTMVINHVPRKLHNNLRKCIKFLKKNEEKMLGLKGKSIRTYKFCNGEILSRQDGVSA